MRIISKFQDYYDCGLAYGQDENIVFTRHTDKQTDWHKGSSRYWGGGNPNLRPHKLQRTWVPDRMLRRHNLPKDIRPEYTRYGMNQIITPMFLNFCGQRYFFYKVKYETFTGKKFLRYCWTQKEADKYTKVANDRYLSDQHCADDDAWGPKNDNDINLKYKSPIVIEVPADNCTYITVNPRLNDYGFSRVLDPYTAFQEISMYLAGPLSPWQDPDLAPEPSGAEKMSSKGMDPRYGFRHRKET